MKSQTNKFNFTHLTIHELIEKRNAQVGNEGWTSSRAQYLWALNEAFLAKGQDFSIGFHTAIRLTKKGRIKAVKSCSLTFSVKNQKGDIDVYKNVVIVKKKHFNLYQVTEPLYVGQKSVQTVTIDFAKYSGTWQSVSLSPFFEITGSTIVINCKGQKFMQQFFAKDFIIMKFNPRNMARFLIGANLEVRTR